MQKDKKYLITKMNKSKTLMKIGSKVVLLTTSIGLGLIIGGAIKERKSGSSNYISNSTILTGCGVLASSIIPMSANLINKASYDASKNELTSMELSSEDRKLLSIVKNGSIVNKIKAIKSLLESGYTYELIQLYTGIKKDMLSRIQSISCEEEYVALSVYLLAHSDINNMYSPEEEAEIDKIQQEIIRNSIESEKKNRELREKAASLVNNSLVRFTDKSREEYREYTQKENVMKRSK